MGAPARQAPPLMLGIEILWIWLKRQLKYP